MTEAASSDVKEVAMDVPVEQTGGGTRRRRRAGGRRKTRGAGGIENGPFQEGGSATTVEKEHAVAAPAPATQSGGAKKAVAAPVVVLAPAKKKTAKVMLVPKSKVAAAPAKKTFKAKRVGIVIDNTAKTHKHRKQVLGRIDAMTEDQLRGMAVSAKLSRRETVAKVPVDLLRQMLRDYYIMRGQLL